MPVSTLTFGIYMPISATWAAGTYAGGHLRNLGCRQHSSVSSGDATTAGPLTSSEVIQRYRLDLDAAIPHSESNARSGCQRRVKR